MNKNELEQMGINTADLHEKTKVVRFGSYIGVEVNQPNGRTSFNRVLTTRQIRQREKTLARKAAKKARRKAGGKA